MSKYINTESLCVIGSFKTVYCLNVLVCVEPMAICTYQEFVIYAATWSLACMALLDLFHLLFYVEVMGLFCLK